ncbi:MAG: sulfatase-like hydrolase/transferase [Planctomycetota bacterium]
MPRLTSALVMLFLATAAPVSAVDAPRRPNVVLIMADDMGFERVGLYGGKDCRTLHLDRMAAEGMRFDYCFAAPICTPTRVMMMTGKYNHRNYTQFSQWPAGESSFGNMMKKSGYVTAVVDKWQLGSATPAELGFDEYCLFSFRQYHDPGSHERYWHPAIGANDGAVVTTEDDYGPDIFLRYCQDFIRRNRERPFFLYWALGAPHAPWQPAPESGVPKNSKPDARYYPDIVAHLDKNVGRLIATVDDLGLADKTLILFTGDNGTPKAITTTMPGGRVIEGGKGAMTDAGTRVPFIARWSGHIEPGSVSRELITLCDVYPTLAELADVDLSNRQHDGCSLVPVLEGCDVKPREWVFMSFKSQWPEQRTGKHRVSAWARDHCWKLYDDGKIYNVKRDPEERSPASGSEAEAARQKLEPVLPKVGATPEALAKFRDANARSLEVKRTRGQANE